MVHWIYNTVVKHMVTYVSFVWWTNITQKNIVEQGAKPCLYHHQDGYENILKYILRRTMHCRPIYITPNAAEQDKYFE